VHQIDEKIEHLRIERNQFGPAAQIASLGIEHVITKPEDQPRLPAQPDARLKEKKSSP